MSSANRVECVIDEMSMTLNDEHLLAACVRAIRYQNVILRGRQAAMAQRSELSGGEVEVHKGSRERMAILEVVFPQHGCGRLSSTNVPIFQAVATVTTPHCSRGTKLRKRRVESGSWEAEQLVQHAPYWVRFLGGRQSGLVPCGILEARSKKITSTS